MKAINSRLCWLIENSDNDPWLKKYNDLVLKIKSGELIFDDEYMRKQREEWKDIKVGSRNVLGLGKHHILPKSLFPELKDDDRNIVKLPFREHMDLHYFLWKHDKSYARQLWFGCVFGRKHKMWDLPGGETEYEQLKADLRKKRL